MNKKGRAVGAKELDKGFYRFRYTQSHGSLLLCEDHIEQSSSEAVEDGGGEESSLPTALQK